MEFYLRWPKVVFKIFSFVIFPLKGLTIFTKTRPDYACSEADIEVAMLITVYWLHITGNFHTRKLTPGTKYEAVFILNLDDTAAGWEEPVTLKLKLEHRGGSQSIQERTLSLDDYIGDGNNWVDIQVGEFEAPPKSAAAKIFFSLHQYVDTDRKDGLVVKGVAIRPTARDQVTI